MEKVSPEPTDGTKNILPGQKGDKSWHEILDVDRDGKVTAKDVNIALFLAGQTVPPNNFERVVNDPNLMGNFFDKEKFQEDLDRYTIIVKERDSKLMSAQRYAICRWLQQSLCLGFLFLERFFPGVSIKQKKYRNHVKVMIGYCTAFCSFAFIVAPTVMALILGVEFKGLFKFQFSYYALYYPFGFCFR